MSVPIYLSESERKLHHLYDTHPELKEFINFWVEERRCPIGLPDWFAERNMYGAANAANWAATAPDTPDHTGYLAGPSPYTYEQILTIDKYRKDYSTYRPIVDSELRGNYLWIGLNGRMHMRQHPFEFPGSTGIVGNTKEAAILNMLASCDLVDEFRPFETFNAKESR